MYQVVTETWLSTSESREKYDANEFFWSHVPRRNLVCQLLCEEESKWYSTATTLALTRVSLWAARQMIQN